jgi:hypothetical protein
MVGSPVKYRRPILTDEVAIGLRKLIREVCLSNEVQILDLQNPSHLGQNAILSPGFLD